MAAIHQMKVWNAFSHTESLVYIQTSQQFVSEGPADKPVLVHVMASCQTGNKLLPKSMMTQFTANNIQHQAPMMFTHH